MRQSRQNDDFGTPMSAKLTSLVRQSRQNGDFGVAKLLFWGHFVVALRSFWAHFGVSWISVGDVRSLDGYFAILWCHFRYMKVHSEKTLIIPTDLNVFIKLWS